MYCKKCGFNMSESSNVCPSCGADQSTSSQSDTAADDISVAEVTDGFNKDIFSKKTYIRKRISTPIAAVLTIGVLIILVAAACLAYTLGGEKSSRVLSEKKLCGVWTTTYDLKNMYALSDGSRISLTNISQTGRYLISNIKTKADVDMYLSFSDDGTCKLLINKDSVMNSYKNFSKDVNGYLSADGLYEFFKEMGISRSDVDTELTLKGYTMEKYLNEVQKSLRTQMNTVMRTIENNMGDTDSDGNFSVSGDMYYKLDGNKIHITADEKTDILSAESLSIEYTDGKINIITDDVFGFSASEGMIMKTVWEKKR